MSGTLDLGSVEILGIAECDLADSAITAPQWPCPACGDPQPLERAWALKVRNHTEPHLERGVVVCNECFARLGDAAVARVSDEPVAISGGDDPAELLQRALDTDEVELPFGAS